MKSPPTIDTRFVLASFFETPGTEKEKIVRKARELRESRAYVPTIVLHEVYKYMFEKKGAEVAKHRVNTVAQSTFQIVSLDTRIALSSAELRCRDRDLPTADSIIAATALAVKSNAVVTDDPHFKRVEGIRTEWV